MWSPPPCARDRVLPARPDRDPLPDFPRGARPMAIRQTKSSTRSGNRRRSRSASSCLFQLDQRAEEVLGVQEQHRLAMGADLRLAIAQHARAFGLQVVARGDDIVDLVADMVDAPA